MSAQDCVGDVGLARNGGRTRSLRSGRLGIAVGKTTPEPGESSFPGLPFLSAKFGLSSACPHQDAGRTLLVALFGFFGFLWVV